MKYKVSVKTTRATGWQVIYEGRKKIAQQWYDALKDIPSTLEIEMVRNEKQ